MEIKILYLQLQIFGPLSVTKTSPDHLHLVDIANLFANNFFTHPALTGQHYHWNPHFLAI